VSGGDEGGGGGGQGGRGGPARKILNRIKVYNDSMTLGKKSFIRFSFLKLDLQLLIEKNPILIGKCSISKWAYKFDHDQLLSGLSHVS